MRTPVIPEDRYYTRHHQWVKIDEALVTVGVTEPILRRIKPLVSLTLPDPEDEMKLELPYGKVEGLEETLTLYPPVEASVIEVHDELICNLDRLTNDPYGKGWLVKIRVHNPQDLKGLLTAQAYAEHCQKEWGEQTAGG